MKSRRFSEKEKNKCSQTDSQNVQFWQKQTKLWNTGGHKPSDHQRKLTSFPDDENGERTKKSVTNEAVAPLKDST